MYSRPVAGLQMYSRPLGGFHLKMTSFTVLMLMSGMCSEKMVRGSDKRGRQYQVWTKVCTCTSLLYNLGLHVFQEDIHFFHYQLIYLRMPCNDVDECDLVM